ncbi:MAG: type II-B CRISPR-associated RNA-guided endonuclease Cas9/Csx12 [Brevinematia bacterium]
MKFVVSIDQGAKNTGIVIAETEKDSLKNVEGNVIVIDEANFKLSQLDRRTKRHQRRGYKRRKLAKRLLKLILEKEFKWDFSKLNKAQKDFIFGLINRRGFNYIIEDMNEDILNNFDFLDFIVRLFPESLNKEEKLTEQILKNSSNPDWFKKIVDNENSKFLTKKDSKQSERLTLKEYCQKNNFEYSEELQDFYDEFVDTISQFYNEMVGGAKPRKKYFEEIKAVIFAETPIDDLFKDNFNKDKFFKLVAHISNFQLRVLRKYFNDEKMKNGDYWDEKKLKKIILREVRSWHTSGNEELKNRRSKLIKLLKEDKSLLDIWFGLDPIETIPPYEDMNNRNIPDCQTLYLDPQKLSEKYGNWKEIVNKLLEKESDSHIKEGLLENKWVSLEKQKISDDDKLARILQRFFDRVKDKDPYKFRLLSLSKDKSTEEYKKAINSLKQTINNEKDVELLLSIARTYFVEQENAKKGLWDANNTILKKCNLHTKHKANLSHIIIGGILDVKMNQDEVNNFYNFLKNTKVKRKTLMGIAHDCSELVKKEGNKLRAKLEMALNDEKNCKKLEKEQNGLLSIYKDVIEGAKKISEYIKKDNPDRYSDIWSFAQIYNVLEGDRHGFSKICEICHEENAFRSSEFDNSVMFTRLFADSVRPFDGVVDRLVRKQADVISKLILEKLKNKKVKKDEKIEINFIAEQNEFSFEEELKSIKGKPSKDKEKFDEEKAFNSKIERIMRFNSLCPYTGDPIGENGDIDHILPRSWTKKQYGAVFNDEMNLIYSSVRGNRELKSRGENGLWEFDELSNSFLNELYGTDDKNEIKKIITNTLTKLGILEGTYKGKIIFSRLDKDTQRDLRIALFIPEYRELLVNYLNNSLAARVNGTQSYLLKLIVKNIKKEYSKVRVNISKVDSELIQQFRKDLVTGNKELTKNREGQSLYSHVVDASIALFFNVESGDFNKCLPEGIKVIEAKALSSIHKLKKKDFYSTSVFKDGIYGEKFVPVILYKEKLYFGFDTKNCVMVKKNEENIFNLISPYLRYRNGKSFIDANNKNFDEWKEISNKIPLRFFVNKTKTFDFFAKIAKEPFNENEKAIFNILEGLRYTTQKVELLSLLTNSDKKNYLTKDEIFESDNFKIKIFNKELTFPGRKFIENILESNEIKDKLGKPIKDNKIDIDIIKKFFKNLYGGKSITDPRVKARKVFSVNVIKSPSGGFRIKRKDLYGAKTYQLVEISDRASIGFEIKDGKIDKESFVLHPVLYYDKNIVPVGEVYKPYPEKYVPMDEWREIELTDKEKSYINRLWICPGTKNRSYYRIQLSIEQFVTNLLPGIDEELCKILENNKGSIYRLLIPLVKLNLDNIYFLNDEEIKKIILGPRSDKKDGVRYGKVRIIEANKDNVLVEYEANGFMPEEAQRRYVKAQK